MIHIKKGSKTKFDGVLLTKEEYKRYKKLNKSIQLFNTYKKEYDMTYRDYYM